MLTRLFPKQIDNTYHGYKMALWLFALVLFLKIGISLGSIFNGRVAAGSADAIPIDTFTPAGAQAIVSLFALLGLSSLIFCLLGVLVLVRYRAFVPLMFALLLLEHLCKKLVLLFIPIERIGGSVGSVAYLTLLAILIVGLALSVWRSKSVRQQG